MIKKNTESFLIPSNEISLEVNVEKTKYMVMSQGQHVGQNQDIMIGNKSLKNVEQSRYLGTNQTSIHEEIKCGSEASP
jgi:ribosomal protein S4E